MGRRSRRRRDALEKNEHLPQQKNGSEGNPPGGLSGGPSESSLREARYQFNLQKFERQSRSSRREEKENSTDRSLSLPPPRPLPTPARKEKPNHIYFVGLLKYIRGKNVLADVFENTKLVLELEKLNPKSIQARDVKHGRTEKEFAKHKEELSRAQITVLPRESRGEEVDIVTAFDFTSFYPSQTISPHWVGQTHVWRMRERLKQDGMAIVTTNDKHEIQPLLSALETGFLRIVQKELRHEDGTKEYLFLAFRQYKAVGESKTKSDRTHRKGKENVSETRRGANEIYS